MSHQGNNLFVVDGKQARYIDCNAMPLPFGPQFVADIVNRTHLAQNQDEALLAAELVIKAQKNARFVTLESRSAGRRNVVFSFAADVARAASNRKTRTRRPTLPLSVVIVPTVN